MEVHAPHEPIHSVKDFLLHLFTITIGLLIAVGIEGLVEWRHHVHLVNEAKATLREEVAHNMEQMEKALPALKVEREDIELDLKALKRIQVKASDNNAQNITLTADFKNFTLRETAWKTAQASGAVGYMPYADAQRYADIYQTQDAYLAANQKIVDDEAILLGLMARFNLSGTEKITIDEADILAERYGIWRGHLLFSDLMARLNSESYKAFLENKPAPKQMHEDLQVP